MALKKNANWERWVQGELVASLQAQGKLPKKQTAATAYKDRAYQNTHDRIFPSQAAGDPATCLLLSQTHKAITAKITQATNNHQPHNTEPKLLNPAQDVHPLQHSQQHQQATAASAAAPNIAPSSVCLNQAQQQKQQQDDHGGPKTGGFSGSVCGSHVSRAGSVVSSRVSCRTHKFEIKARIADLQQQLAQEAHSVKILEARLAEAQADKGKQQKQWQQYR